MPINSSTTLLNNYEERVKVLKHGEDLLEAELSRLSGEPTYTIDEMKNCIKDLYASDRV